MRGRTNIWLLLFVVICAGSLWLGKDLVPRGSKSAVEGGVSPVPAPSYAMSKEDAPIHLAVLNGTSEAGLARKVSLLLGRTGCVAESFGNAPRRDFSHSILVNRKLSAGRAAALARRLGGIRVIREWDSRGSEDAVLVLGRDFAQLEAGLEGKLSSGG